MNILNKKRLTACKDYFKYIILENLFFYEKGPKEVKIYPVTKIRFMNLITLSNDSKDTKEFWLSLTYP